MSDERRQRIIHRVIERLDGKIHALVKVRNRIQALADSYDTRSTDEVDHETDAGSEYQASENVAQRPTKTTVI